MTRVETDLRNPDNERKWRLELEKQFRQSCELVKIFYEIYKNQENRYNPETGQVLYDTSYDSENTEDNETQTNKFFTITETWIRVLDDSSVEIQYDYTKYHQDDSSHAVEVDDIPDELSKLITYTAIRDQENQFDPLGQYSEMISGSPRQLARRWREVFILRPNETGGTVEKNGWAEVYDPDGTNPKQKVMPSSEMSVGDKEANLFFMTLRLDLFSELRATLNKAVESEKPEYYQLLLSEDVRKRIQAFALREIQIATKNETLELRAEVSVNGSAEIRHNFISPQVEYYERKINHTDNRITYEHSQLVHGLSQSYIASIVEVPSPIPTTVDHLDWTDKMFDCMEVIEQWRESRIGMIGEEAFQAEIRAEIERLKEELMANIGSAHGQIRQLKVDPNSGTYTYQFFQRIPADSFHNPTVEIVSDTYTGNPENPLYSELDMLLRLAV